MTTWHDRLRDARRFWEVAEAALDPEHVNQAASNAILAVIAANDAVCLHLGEGKPRGRSHTEAATMLQEVCRGTAWEGDAAKRSRQLVGILRLKTAVQYEGRLLDVADANRVMRQARRFIEWAQTILPPSTK
jgi:hypothetical protein